MNYSIQADSINHKKSLAPRGRGMLVVIDPSVADSHRLVTGVIAGATVLVLDPARDGILEIGDYLRQQRGFTSLHLVCHGAPGSLYLGSSKLTLENLAGYTPLLQQWGKGMGSDREIRLYGCQVAKTPRGREFVKALSEVTSAPIAASTDLTGNSALGGTWQFAYQTGEIKADLAFAPEVMATYPAVLAVNIANGDIQGLIDAINAANAGGDSVINLASNGTYEFLGHTGPFNTPADNPNLNRGWSGLPAILTSITINGNNSIIRKSSNATEEARIFYVDGNGTATGNLTLNEVVLENGNANLEFVGNIATNGGDDGGAIFNDRGKVTINNSTLRNNEALDDGGAISNFNGEVTINGSTINANKSLGGTTDGGVVENDGASAKLVINSSTLSGNEGDQGGAIRNRNGGTVEVNNSTLTQNIGFNGGGGIFNSGGVVTVRNSIIAGNTGPSNTPDLVGEINGNSNNLIGNTLGSTGSIGTGSDIVNVGNLDLDITAILNTNLNANGLLDRDPVTHALVTGSPAIDAGAGFDKDQRGAVAIGIPDIGAHEFGAQSSGTIKDESNAIVPDDTGSVDFGGVTQGNTIQKTFTIESTGTLPLSLNSWTLPTGFSFVGGFPNSVAGTNDPNTPVTQTFTVQLDGTSVGTFTGDLSFQINDSTVNNPYNFNLTGTVTQPLILQVLDPANNDALIADDTGTFDFGTTNKNIPLQAMLLLNNPSTTTRNLSNFSLPTGFELVGTSFPTMIAANSQESFTIQFNADTVGDISGELSFQTDDPNLNNPYNFTLEATVESALVLQVFDANNQPIADDTGVFNFTPINQNTPTQFTFTISNPSPNAVALSNFIQSDGLEIVGAFPTTIAGTSDPDTPVTETFTVELTASELGNYSGEISFQTDEPEINNPYNFKIEGPVVDPDIKLQVFADTLFIPDDTGMFQFVSTNENEPGQMAFTLKNVSSDTVTLSDFTLPNGFSLTSAFPETIAGNSEVEFTVQLDALAEGNFNGELSFLTDDENLTDSIYNFDIGGIVNKLPLSGGNPGTGGPFDRLRVDVGLKRFTTGNQGGGNLKLQLADDSSDRITQISIVYLNANGDRTLTDVLFTALPARFRPNGYNASRQLYILEQIASNQSFEIELQTIDGNILTQEVSFSEISTGRFQVNFTEGISLFLEQTSEGTPLGVGSIQEQGKEFLDLRSISGSVNGNFRVYREASFNNSVGFYLADENGTVNGLAPGDSGYAEAAINNRLSAIELFTANQGISEFSTVFSAGSILMPFIIVDGTPEQFLANNASNSINNDPIAYFPFIGANPDQVDHIRLLANNTFGFEDLVNGGDNDFNDMIIEVTLTQV